jgi:hypothetical protein
MYQRSVAHARGWRQLPNYSFWSGIGGFFSVSWQYLIPGRTHMKSRGCLSVSDGLLPTVG